MDFFWSHFVLWLKRMISRKNCYFGLRSPLNTFFVDTILAICQNIHWITDVDPAIPKERRAKGCLLRNILRISIQKTLISIEFFTIWILSVKKRGSSCPRKTNVVNENVRLCFLIDWTTLAALANEWYQIMTDPLWLVVTILTLTILTFFASTDRLIQNPGSIISLGRNSLTHLK